MRPDPVNDPVDDPLDDPPGVAAFGEIGDSGTDSGSTFGSGAGARRRSGCAVSGGPLTAIGSAGSTTSSTGDSLTAGVSATAAGIGLGFGTNVGSSAARTSSSAMRCVGSSTNAPRTISEKGDASCGNTYRPDESRFG